jgi:hypothetical protein
MEYYNEEGNSEPLVISLKKGSYIPAFTTREKTNELPYPVTTVPDIQNNMST